MITKEVKSRAIALLKHSQAPEDIAEELGLPVKLVEEWESNLDGNDLMAIESELFAIDKLANGVELVPMNVDKLKNAIEGTALNITAAMDVAMKSNVLTTGDVHHAKSLEVMANGLVKMYHTIVMKGGAIEHDPQDQPSGNSLSVFENMMRD